MIETLWIIMTLLFMIRGYFYAKQGLKEEKMMNAMKRQALLNRRNYKEYELIDKHTQKQYRVNARDFQEACELCGLKKKRAKVIWIDQ